MTASAGVKNRKSVFRQPNEVWATEFREGG
jgi:hypothetical protein